MTNLKFYIIFMLLTCIYGRSLKENHRNNDHRNENESGGGNGNSIYMNQFAVKIDGGQKVADEIASRHGFTNMGQVSNVTHTT